MQLLVQINVLLDVLGLLPQFHNALVQLLFLLFQFILVFLLHLAYRLGPLDEQFVVSFGSRHFYLKLTDFFIILSKIVGLQVDIDLVELPFYILLGLFKLP